MIKVNAGCFEASGTTLDLLADVAIIMFCLKKTGVSEEFLKAAVSKGLENDSKKEQ